MKKGTFIEFLTYNLIGNMIYKDKLIMNGIL